MKSAFSAWLFAACAIAAAGCTSDPKTQVLTGKLSSTQHAIAVRAVDGTTVITAARVRSDGSFTLQLPAGHHYRLEVLTANGVHNIVAAKNGSYADVAFSVCQPKDPFDMGGCGQGGGGGTMCAPNDPMCTPPPPCDPTTDPDCKPPCDPNDPTCTPPPPCDPMTDPNCKPRPCDPSTDPNCMTPPPPCDPMTDPNCKSCPTEPTT
jgi:hypothetical protein